MTPKVFFTDLRSHAGHNLLDQACADMVNEAPVIGRGNVVAEKMGAHEHCHDKFHIMHPDTKWQVAQEHAQKLGLGTVDYELVRI